MITDAEVSVKNQQLLVSMDIDASRLALSSNDLLTVTPVVTDNSGANRIELPSVILTGATRHKALQRAIELGNPLPYQGNPYASYRRANGTQQVVPYKHALTLEPWMKEASLNLLTSLSGCANCYKASDEIELIGKVIKEPYRPQYQLTYIAPLVEPVKARADEYSAQLNFIVAKHDIVRGLGDNARILDEADKINREVMGNKDLTITNFEFTGWASPEGRQQSNQALSERRANSFANYLISRHGLDRRRIRIAGRGEDWSGVRNLVEMSSLADKGAVLRIIDGVADLDARDAQLRKLSGGSTYQTLLRDMYPQVRRTIYKIAYNVRAFDVEEAKQIIRTNPKLLSLNEMYLVAQTYDPCSKEFKEVFDIAARLYPDEPIAIINASAADIEGGNYQAAIDRLKKLRNNPNATNNMGVAYARMGNTEKAKELFSQAATAGSTQAKHNLSELERTMQE